MFGWGTDWRDFWSRLGLETKHTETLAPILIIDKSRSRTRQFVYLSRSLRPGLVLNYWKSEKFAKVSSGSRLGLKTRDTRLSVSSRSHFNFDCRRVSDSSISDFFKNVCDRSCRKTLVSYFSGTRYQILVDLFICIG